MTLVLDACAIIYLIEADAALPSIDRGDTPFPARTISPAAA